MTARANPDRLIAGVGALAALFVAVVLVLVGVSTVWLALPSLRELGATFLLKAAWSPTRGQFGVLPFAFGTAVTTVVGLILAVPIALGVAVFVTDLGPPSMRGPARAIIDLLAAIPSVVYGLWAALVLAPVLRAEVEPWLEAHLGGLALFRGPKLGIGLLCASVVLAIMILPTIAAVAREVIGAVPSELREGGLALGATRWDVVRRVILPHARSGIIGAVLLGAARAASETMAMAAVVGSRPEISASLFSPGYTMASVIANEFPTAEGELHVAALAEVGLVLFLVTLVFNVAARLLVGRIRDASIAGGAR